MVVQTCSTDPLHSNMTQKHQCKHQHLHHTPLLLQIRTPPLGTTVTLATRWPPCFLLNLGHKVGWGNSQKRFAPGCCVPCGGANLQQGPTTVKHDTGAPVQTPASSPRTSPTPNQDAPSRHCSDVGNTLATVFPSTRETRWVEKKTETVCTRLLHPLWWCKLAAGTHYSQK